MKKAVALVVLVLLVGALSGCARDNRGDYPDNPGPPTASAIFTLVSPSVGS